MNSPDRGALAVLVAAAHRPRIVVRTGVVRGAIASRLGAAPRDDRAQTAHTINRMNVMTPIGSITMLSMYEAMARERMRDAQQSAAERRLSARLKSERIWQRLARLAARREARAHRLADEARESYSLAA